MRRNAVLIKLKSFLEHQDNMQYYAGGDDLKAEKAAEKKAKMALALARKYNVTEDYINSLISLNLYNKSQKNFHQKFSVIEDLLSGCFGFEYSSDMCGDGTDKNTVVAATPFVSIIQKNTTYNCCGTNMSTAAEMEKVEKALKKYENAFRSYRKPVALGERAKKKPEVPNFLKGIEDGVLVCGNSEDLTFSVRFLKPQDCIVAEERILKDYCGGHACPMRDGFGENRKVYFIDGTDFIKAAGRIIKERDVSGGRIFPDADNIVEGFVKEFPQRKPEVTPEIA
jgi:hypothetical protein